MDAIGWLVVLWLLADNDAGALITFSALRVYLCANTVVEVLSQRGLFDTFRKKYNTFDGNCSYNRVVTPSLSLSRPMGILRFPFFFVAVKSN